MIIRGLKWRSNYGGWGDTMTQVEFNDGANARYILVSILDEDWTIHLSTKDIMDLFDEEEYDHGCIETMDGELLDLLPQIVKSQYALDICFTMQTLREFPGFEQEEIWDSSAEKYISEYIGKDSKEVV